MDIDQPLPLLAGLTAAQFMRRHWQKKPLLVRGAIANFKPLLSRAELTKLAGTDAVQSRLIVKSSASWRMKTGPFAPRSLPPISRQGWTLLVQNVDAHNSTIHQLLQQFRFVPDAVLDDLMISLASTGGGVGPHFDSYDVFLLQASGRREWKISRQKDLTLKSDMPLKILQNFVPETTFVLEAGDMLYLPPRYAHDGIALAAAGAKGQDMVCMTYSIGFKAPLATELGAEVLHKLAEFSEDAAEPVQTHTGLSNKRPSPMRPLHKQARRFRDPAQAATPAPAELPQALIGFASSAAAQALGDPLAVACAVGEIMTTPKASLWFEEASSDWADAAQYGLVLDIKTKMMYGTDHVFINGESYLAKGADATLMRALANNRRLSRVELAKASSAATTLLADWHAAGWLRVALTLVA